MSSNSELAAAGNALCSVGSRAFEHLSCDVTSQRGAYAEKVSGMVFFQTRYIYRGNGEAIK
jgi:hypothetical protein